MPRFFEGGCYYPIIKIKDGFQLFQIRTSGCCAMLCCKAIEMASGWYLNDWWVIREIDSKTCAISEAMKMPKTVLEEASFSCFVIQGPRPPLANWTNNTKEFLPVVTSWWSQYSIPLCLDEFFFCAAVSWSFAGYKERQRSMGMSQRRVKERKKKFFRYRNQVAKPL